MSEVPLYEDAAGAELYKIQTRVRRVLEAKVFFFLSVTLEPRVE